MTLLTRLCLLAFLVLVLGTIELELIGAIMTASRSIPENIGEEIVPNGSSSQSEGMNNQSWTVNRMKNNNFTDQDRHDYTKQSWDEQDPLSAVHNLPIMRIDKKDTCKPATQGSLLASRPLDNHRRERTITARKLNCGIGAASSCIQTRPLDIPINRFPVIEIDGVLCFG